MRGYQRGFVCAPELLISPTLSQTIRRRAGERERPIDTDRYCVSRTTRDECHMRLVMLGK